MGLIYVSGGQVVSGSTGSTTVIGIDGTIPAGSTSVILNHNLGSIPSYFSATAKNSYAAGVQITAVTANTITASIDNIQAADALIKVGVAI